MRRICCATSVRHVQRCAVLHGGVDVGSLSNRSPLLASARCVLCATTRPANAPTRTTRAGSVAPSASAAPVDADATTVTDAGAPSQSTRRPLPASSHGSAATSTPAAAAPPARDGPVSQPAGTASQDPQAVPSPPPPPLPESVWRSLFASWQQGVVASIGAVMGIGFLVYFLYTPVKEDTVHHTAVVASEALADVRLRGHAVQLSKEVVLDVLRDPKSLDATADVVVGLLAREETKIAVSSLLQSLFEDHYTQEVTKKFVLQVVQDPWIQDQLQGITEEQVRKLLNNDSIKKELSRFLLESAVDGLEKPQLHYQVATAMRRSVASFFNFWWA
ncbi:hypothetical protein NESM_000653900 [Novymonas esmeraldas]|uniref:Uncharacterized protein n=1 Tax=Novymonas esmeraldas TaxID=1808958 RepID=A0AAW0EUI2_9TRYP